MNFDWSALPKLGFGCMRLPTEKHKIDHGQLCRMVDAYMAAGLNYFDTAYIYHGGKSEKALREALVKRHPRESFWLVDKLPQWMMKDASDRDRIFQTQLERTGAEYFDVYLLHSIEDGANYEGYVKYDCFRWLQQKQAEGRVRHIGFSYHGTPELLDRILTEHPEMEIVQIQLNYADWNNPLVQSGRLYEVLRKHDKPILVMEPVKGGMLAQLPEAAESLFRQAQPEMSVASWALRFAASLPGVVTVLSGMSTEAQLQDNLNTFAHFRPLDDAEQALIRRATGILLSKDTVQCTACRYCTDGCPMGISIPDVFKALNALRLYGEDGRPHFFYDGLVAHSSRAESCVACGQCEAVCPQHLPIISLLKEASEKLDHFHRR